MARLQRKLAVRVCCALVNGPANPLSLGQRWELPTLDRVTAFGQKRTFGRMDSRRKADVTGGHMRAVHWLTRNLVMQLTLLRLAPPFGPGQNLFESRFPVGSTDRCTVSDRSVLMDREEEHFFW